MTGVGLFGHRVPSFHLTVPFYRAGQGYKTYEFRTAKEFVAGKRVLNSEQPAGSGTSLAPSTRFLKSSRGKGRKTPRWRSGGPRSGALRFAPVLHAAQK